MLELARRRLGTDASLQVADLAGPLPFSDGAFDDVVASLVLHHLQDWAPTLTEFRRVLVPGGRLIASVDHPFAVYLRQRIQGQEANYFKPHNWIFEWTVSGQKMLMSFWNRPLHADDRLFHLCRVPHLGHQRAATTRRGPRCGSGGFPSSVDEPELRVLRAGDGAALQWAVCIVPILPPFLGQHDGQLGPAPTRPSWHPAGCLAAPVAITPARKVFTYRFELRRDGLWAQCRGYMLQMERSGA